MEIVYLLLGGVIGFFVNSLFKWNEERSKRKKQKYAESQSRNLIINYNPMKDDLWELTKWSYKRKLNKDKMIVRYEKNRPNILHIPMSEIEKRAKIYMDQNIKGPVCYLIDYVIDSQDQDIEDLYRFEIKVSLSDYSEHMAIYDYLKEHPTVKQDIINILKEDPKIYFRNALPSNIAINVVVISELNNILAVKRSSAVANAKNEWTVGPFETMIYNFNAPAESDSSFDSLARRCLKEELGIEANDYKEIFISWVGLSLLSMRLHVVAIVKIQSTTEANIERKMRKAHGYYEASMVQWLPLDEVQIKNFIENNSGVYMDSINQQEGKWSPFTSLALTEALRVKDYDLFPNSATF